MAISVDYIDLKEDDIILSTDQYKLCCLGDYAWVSVGRCLPMRVGKKTSDGYNYGLQFRRKIIKSKEYIHGM